MISYLIPPPIISYLLSSLLPSLLPSPASFFVFFLWLSSFLLSFIPSFFLVPLYYSIFTLILYDGPHWNHFYYPPFYSTSNFLLFRIFLHFHLPLICPLLSPISSLPFYSTFLLSSISLFHLLLSIHSHLFYFILFSYLLGVSGGAIAGIVIGVLAAVGICIGFYTHQKNKKKAQESLLKNQSDHGFEEVRG